MRNISYPHSSKPYVRSLYARRKMVKQSYNRSADQVRLFRRCVHGSAEGIVFKIFPCILPRLLSSLFGFTTKFECDIRNDFELLVTNFPNFRR